MKVFLLHPDRDFWIKPGLEDPVFRAMLERGGNPYAIEDARRTLERERAKNPAAAPPSFASDQALTQDLELTTLWRAMAAGDEFLFETARRGLLSSTTSTTEILYRQQVLADCLAQPEVVRQIYALALEGLDAEREAGSLWNGAQPDRILRRSVKALKLHVDILKRLRLIADEQAEAFRSPGFTRFFAMLREELSDDYLATVEGHLTELELKHGVLETARLGKGLKGRSYVVRRQRELTWRERLTHSRRTSGYTFELHPRDEAGFRALEAIRGHGINGVANAAAQSSEHVKSFFTMLRLELAFYLGCLNLHERLVAKGEPVCFPEPLAAEEVALAAEGLYDVSLAQHLDERVVGNDVDAEAKDLLVITGANQGGKSTFLRSMGLAQLMMQAGMFVGAASFKANVCAGVFTHYKREEDETMESGKLDEELRRMSAIARQLIPNAMLLCNESFASTNEREGSEIARQIVRALLAKRIKVAFVTHMYDLAHGFYEQQLETALFLRAERQEDGARTFRLHEAPPLPTSYGEDSYRRIFSDRISHDAAVAGG